MRASVPPAPPRAGRREWIGLAVIALPCLLYSMDLTVLNLAVPRLSADLKPSSCHRLGAELLGTAREAFTHAFQLTAAISSAVALITALLATALLRRVRVGSQLEEQAESLS